MRDWDILNSFEYIRIIKWITLPMRDWDSPPDTSISKSISIGITLPMRDWDKSHCCFHIPKQEIGITLPMRDWDSNKVLNYSCLIYGLHYLWGIETNNRETIYPGLHLFSMNGLHYLWGIEAIWYIT